VSDDRCGIASNLCSRLSLSVSASSAASGSMPNGSNASCAAVARNSWRHAIVVVEQCAVVENQMLPHDAFERSRLLEQLAARATRLRGLLHGLAALRLQLIERQDELAERIEQRQAHQQEAQQDEFEEGPGVIHGRRRYNLRQL
jgi:hypothetical protein